MTDQEVLQLYISFVPFMAKVCGPGCEIVVHDIRNPQCSLIAIENSLSGRKLGNPLTELARDLAEQGKYLETDYVANYSGRTKKNDFLSSTYFIKNEGRLIGMLCVNKDISAIKQMSCSFAHLQEYFNLIVPNDSEYSENLDNPVDDIMHSRITEVINQGGVSPTRMSIDEKIHVVHRLHESGVTTMKGAVAEIARQLFISVPTVYRYLKKVDTN